MVILQATGGGRKCKKLQKDYSKGKAVASTSNTLQL
jgi:hypothetical protein